MVAGSDNSLIRPLIYGDVRASTGIRQAQLR